MGQPIVVVEKPSSNRGVVRFETNRALTGMGHERYRGIDDITGTRPPDVLARRLFERGGIDAVHVNSNVVTVDFTDGHASDGVKEIIEGLYRFYPDAAEPGEAQHTVGSELEAGAGAAPETTSDPGAVAAPDVSAEEAPGRGGVEGASDAAPVPQPVSASGTEPVPGGQVAGGAGATRAPSADRADEAAPGGAGGSAPTP